MTESQPARLVFGTFEFTPATLELRREGRRLALEPKPARLLAALLDRAGDVVTREELRRVLWGDDTHVDYDRGLAYCVSQVRTALGDQADTPRFVQTLPKRGFRFIAPVTVEQPAPLPRPALAPEPRPTPSPGPTPSPRPAQARWLWLAAAALAVVVLVGWTATSRAMPVVAVSIFDNETGDPAYDRFVTGMSDLVVTRLTALAPRRLGVVGNLAPLRQPRNIRNLKTLAQTLRADYIVLGQLQRQDDGLRFIVHLVRLTDGVHLSATRLVRPVAEARTFEDAVVAEAEAAIVAHVLPAGGS